MSVARTTAYPSFTSHFSPPFHFDRSLPSNRTTASDGGSDGFSPGVTTFGSGQTIPLLYSFWARATPTTAAASTAATAARTDLLANTAGSPVGKVRRGVGWCSGAAAERT